MHPEDSSHPNSEGAHLAFQSLDDRQFGVERAVAQRDGGGARSVWTEVVNDVMSSWRGRIHSVVRALLVTGSARRQS